MINEQVSERHRGLLERSLGFLCVLLAMSAVPGAAQQGYRVPPQNVVQIIDSPPPPSLALSPTRDWMIVAHRRSMPALSKLAQPMLRLAGHRVNPRTNSLHSQSDFERLELLRVSDGASSQIDAPRLALGEPNWAPDGRHFFFTVTTDAAVELWIGDPATPTTRRLTDAALNAARGQPCTWMPDSRHVLCHFVPSNRGGPPAGAEVPGSPIIQEAGGVDAPSWTFQDVLGGPDDEALYDYYMTSQPMLVDITTGSPRAIGNTGIYWTLDPSPDGRHFLAVRIVRPYSYLVQDHRFPKAVEVWDSLGSQRRKIADLPLDEGGPEHLGWRPPGVRDFAWRASRPATLVYVEALDGGDPRRTVEHRDRVWQLDPPFDGNAVELFRTEYRAGRGGFSSEGWITWAASGDLALVSEFDWPTRQARTWVISADRPDQQPRLLSEHNTDDWYANPGDPVLETAPNGKRVLAQAGDWIYMTGPGGSPDGDRPFLDRVNTRTGQRERLFRSDSDSYESVVAILDPQARRLLTRYETTSQPPNYYVVERARGARRALTAFPHPAPEIAAVVKQRVDYLRDDGIPLSGELHLPPSHRPGDRLPVVIWAYPREYTDSAGAGQIRGSPNQFTWIRGASHLLFVTQGYAVLDNASMPIVGGLTANDTYVEQLVASAQAAIDKLVDMGVADRNRIGIAGHSYGAFMTANLLAHSDLFKAGIARSGAYNRSLTPFGFQYERRSFWDAPQVYFRMSPFMQADQINEPLLLIHGAADNNAGTHPMQSERLYHAVRGLGGTVRLVFLPHESHGYQARESVLHAVWEMLQWFDRHVKGAPAATMGADPTHDASR